MSPKLEASRTPQPLDTQELSLHTASILSPLFLILKRIDPPGHYPWQTTRRDLTHYGRSYLDNRIRIHIEGKLHNFHLLAIPMYKTHTGKNMFHLIVCILDIVHPRWRMQLIGVGSDGASSMTSQFQGVVTCLANE